MSKIERPIVVGVFAEESQAMRAIDELRHAGFGNDQIMVAVPGEESAIHHILDNLVNLGMPEEEIKYCKHEFQAGRTIVSVRHNGRHWESASILYRSRIHKYLKRIQGYEGAFPVSSAGILLEDPSYQMLMEKIVEVQPPWKKILIDAGLDKVLDDFV